MIGIDMRSHTVNSTLNEPIDQQLRGPRRITVALPRLTDHPGNLGGSAILGNSGLHISDGLGVKQHHQVDPVLRAIEGAAPSLDRVRPLELRSARRTHR